MVLDFYLLYMPDYVNFLKFLKKQTTYSQVCLHHVNKEITQKAVSRPRKRGQSLRSVLIVASEIGILKKLVFGI